LNQVVIKIQVSTQVCTVCDRELPIESFGKDKRYLNFNGGYSKRCKECTREVERNRYYRDSNEIHKKRQLQYKKIKWVIKNCPICNAQISVKTKRGKYYCQICGKQFLLSEVLGGKNGNVKRANTHGIRLTAIRQLTVT
jgi:predicted RNA-binding Zn-ribbon protein involved in translation (DUF1610 family)